MVWFDGVQPNSINTQPGYYEQGDYEDQFHPFHPFISNLIIM